MVKFRHQQGFAAEGGQSGSKLSQALMRKKEAREVKPVYHPQCELAAWCSWSVSVADEKGSSRGSSRATWAGSELSLSTRQISGSRQEQGTESSRCAASILSIRAYLTEDLGLGVGGAEAVVDGTYFDDPWTGSLGPTSVHVLLCRGQGELAGSHDEVQAHARW